MSWWVPLVASMLGGGLALAGVALTQYLTRQQKHEERVQERRVEQRDVLVDLIDAVEHWAPRAEITSLFLGKASKSDIVEYVDTESGKALRESVRELERVLVRCRLIVTDEELRPLVLQVVGALQRHPDEVNAPILEASDRGDDIMEPVLASIRYYREVKTLAISIQDAALRRLTLA